MSRPFERVIIIYFILSIHSYRARSDDETTPEVETVTVNTTESSILELNTLEDVTDFDNTTQGTSANSTEENEEPSTKTNSSIADISIEIEDTSNMTDTSTTEDFGTVIESDVDENTTTTSEEIITEEGNTTDINGTRRYTTREPQSKQLSVKDALKGIAYYLRAYKFNEYDRRYETDAEAAPR